MSEANILNLVAGYQDACARKQLLENSGSDFSELRHSVANTVNSLHPKRLMLRVADERRLPFEVKAPNTATRKAIAELEAGKAKRFNSVDALMTDLNADD